MKTFAHRASAAATLLALLSAPHAAMAQAATDTVDATGTEHRHAEVRLGFEKIKLPGDESVGLLGTTYLIDLAHGFSVGPAAYGAITGSRGGLFTVGAELAWKTRLVGPLQFQAGYYVGGGGGGVAPVGGGLMLRPHADLLWDFGRFKAGLSYSQVRFPSGQIDSRQLGLVLTADTDFSFIPVDHAGKVSAGSSTGMGFDRIVAVGGSYMPGSSVLTLSGQPMGSSLRYVGMRFERFFNRDSAASDGVRGYWGLETNGGAGGGVAGYAEYLGTAGLEFSPPQSRWRVGVRGALGMGGGGDVDMGGGALVKAATYAGVRVARNLELLGEVGYAKAPDGRFKAPFGAINLAWTLDGPTLGGSVDIGARAPVRTEWVAGTGVYRAARRDGTERVLRNVVLKANRFLDDHWYLSAQVHSAYSGDAGGYTAGLFGGGYETSAWHNWKAGLELVVGAGGGGGVASGGGALIQPMGYLSYRLNESMSARLGIGHVSSASGQLSSPVGELLLAFSFGG